MAGFYYSLKEWHDRVRPSHPARARASAIASRASRSHTGSRSLGVCRLALVTAVLALAGCASAPPKPPPPVAAPPTPPVSQAPVVVRPARPEVLPEAFESDDFIVTIAKPGDTTGSLAARYLGSPDKAWMIEDYGAARELVAGHEVVIPRRDWNPPGVYPSGYQVVPVLVYHNIAAQRKGRLLIAGSTLEEQMRYLKAEGYRAIRLEDFIAHVQNKRQLPRKSVIVSFDDGYKGFLQYARPVLKELGFPAVLFIQTDQIASRPSSGFLSWPELRDLVKDGVEVQPHSKTHRDLRRGHGESESAYARRMQTELGYPLELFRAQLPPPPDGLETVAYPYGAWDDEVLRYVKQYGYTAGFTVRREANAAFVPLLKINRSQVYADWTLDEFKKNVTIFQQEPIIVETPPVKAAPQPSSPSGTPSLRRQWAARHTGKSEELESRGLLRQALDESKIALTIDPTDTTAQEQRKRLESRIESGVAARMQQGQKLVQSSPPEARRHFLAALALNPMAQAPFEALRDAAPAVEAPRIAAPPGRSITHTVRPDETPGSLADLYYGDRSLGERIEKFNGLKPGEPLSVGRLIKIPEIPGVPFLPVD